MDDRDPIDRALRSEPMIEPSPGFVHRVMREAHRVAEEPAPIAFPWRLFAPLLVVTALALVGILIEMSQAAPSQPDTLTVGWSWIQGDLALAAAVTLASLGGSLGLARWVAGPRRPLGF